MTIKERFQRFVSRKSLSSGHSSTSSNSDTSDVPPVPYASSASSGTATPTSTGMPISRPPPAVNTITAGISTSLSNHKISAAAASSPVSTSFLSKTLTWRSSNGDSSAKREKERSSGNRSAEKRERNAGASGVTARRRMHPSERPLTEANLRQQEALSQFKWEFGRRNSLSGWSDQSGISPCCSRRPSLVPPPVA